MHYMWSRKMFKKTDFPIKYEHWFLVTWRYVSYPLVLRTVNGNSLNPSVTNFLLYRYLMRLRGSCQGDLLLLFSLPVCVSACSFSPELLNLFSTSGCSGTATGSLSSLFFFLSPLSFSFSASSHLQPSYLSYLPREALPEWSFLP